MSYTQTQGNKDFHFLQSLPHATAFAPDLRGGQAPESGKEVRAKEGCDVGTVRLGREQERAMGQRARGTQRERTRRDCRPSDGGNKIQVEIRKLLMGQCWLAEGKAWQERAHASRSHTGTGLNKGGRWRPWGLARVSLPKGAATSAARWPRHESHLYPCHCPPKNKSSCSSQPSHDLRRTTNTPVSPTPHVLPGGLLAPEEVHEHPMSM